MNVACISGDSQPRSKVGSLDGKLIRRNIKVRGFWLDQLNRIMAKGKLG